MKTAVLISGQIRDAKSCYENLLEKIINPYNADVFIDTWSPYNSVPDGRDEIIENTLTIDEICKIFKPKLINVEEFNDNTFVAIVKELYSTLDYPTIRNAYDGSSAWETRFEAPTFMHYKIWRVNQLRLQYENVAQFKYDCIIRTRFDLQYDEFPIIQPENNKIYIPNGGDYRGGVSDLTALGNDDAINKYCSLFANYDNYIDNKIGLHAESLLRIHLHLCKLDIQRFHSKIKLRNSYMN